MSAPPILTWNKLKTAYRIFPHKYPAEDFNPNTSVDPWDTSSGGRFHPFDDSAGNRIPTMYCADHNAGALAETLLRDTLTTRIVAPKAIEENSSCMIHFQRDLSLLNLSHSSVASDFSAILTGSSDCYEDSRGVAADIHANYSAVDGIIWTGKQIGQPSFKCFVLFGDRIFSRDITPIEKVRLSSPEGLELLRDACQSRNFTLPTRYA